MWGKEPLYEVDGAFLFFGLVVVVTFRFDGLCFVYSGTLSGAELHPLVRRLPMVLQVGCYDMAIDPLQSPVGGIERPVFGEGGLLRGLNRGFDPLETRFPESRFFMRARPGRDGSLLLCGRTFGMQCWLADKGGNPFPGWAFWSHPPHPGKDHAGGFKAGFLVPAPRPNWLALSGAGFRLGRLFPRWMGGGWVFV